jgi:hypothetical protein
MADPVHTLTFVLDDILLGEGPPQRFNFERSWIGKHQGMLSLFS